MPQSLEEMKHYLRQSYLGRGGVHAVGVSRSEQAIRVYVNPDAALEQPDVLDQLRESAKPFPIIVVREARPRIATDAVTTARPAERPE